MPTEGGHFLGRGVRVRAPEGGSTLNTEGVLREP
jgi:hypothetical protein